LPFARSLFFARSYSYSYRRRTSGHISDGVIASPFRCAQAARRLTRIAYQVLIQGKPIIETSYLGFRSSIRNPCWRERGLTDFEVLAPPRITCGMTASSCRTDRSAVASPWKRALYNDGVAFRYVLLVRPPARSALSPTKSRVSFPAESGRGGACSLPLILPESAVGWIAITEVRAGAYPAASLAHLEQTLGDAARPPANKPDIALEGTTPLTGPWRC